MKNLQAKGTEVYAVEQVENSIMLNNFIPKEGIQTALIFGNEVDGVQQEVVNQCDGSIEIPQLGTKHSLNISVSAGVVLWSLFEKLRF